MFKNHLSLKVLINNEIKSLIVCYKQIFKKMVREFEITNPEEDDFSDQVDSLDLDIDFD